MEPAKVVILIVQAALGLYTEMAGTTLYPEKLGRRIGAVVTLIAILASALDVALLPRDVTIGWLLAPILLLAVLSPLSGLRESRNVPDGQRIYSTGRLPDSPSRFRDHLMTNLAGAVATCGIVWAVLSTQGLDEYLSHPRPAYVANVALPLAWLVVQAFVSWQQAGARAGLADGADRAAIENAITGYSLRHPHQFLNAVYLTLASFVTLTMVFYLLDFAIARNAEGDPLPMSWPVAVSASLMLLFLLACGRAGAGVNSAVYLTFLTGMPAALVGVILWFSLYQATTTRAVATVVVVTAGYIGYSYQAVAAGRREGEGWQAHYFSATVVAVVIVALLGSLYLS